MGFHSHCRYHGTINPFARLDHGLWVSHVRPAFSGHRADSTVDNLVSKLIWTPPPTWVVPGSTSDVEPGTTITYELVVLGLRDVEPGTTTTYVLVVLSLRAVRAWYYHYICIGSARLYGNVIPSEN